FLVKYSIIQNKLSIITHKILINIGINIYLIINNIFADKLYYLYLEARSNFKPGYITPYYNIKPDIIN
ncbi:hypothetical protein GE21DRAFT_1223059, partial [Neurospora crassa]